MLANNSRLADYNQPSYIALYTPLKSPVAIQGPAHGVVACFFWWRRCFCGNACSACTFCSWLCGASLLHPSPLQDPLVAAAIRYLPAWSQKKDPIKRFGIIKDSFQKKQKLSSFSALDEEFEYVRPQKRIIRKNTTSKGDPQTPGIEDLACIVRIFIFFMCSRNGHLKRLRRRFDG